MVCGAPTPRSSSGRSAVSDDHRDLGQPCLDDRRDRSSPPRSRSCTAAAPAWRRPRSRLETETERGERRDALVVDDVHGHLRSICQRQRHRCRPRPRRDHGVADPEPKPLVDERGAERGLHVGCVGLHQARRQVRVSDRTQRARMCQRARGRPSFIDDTALLWTTWTPAPFPGGHRYRSSDDHDRHLLRRRVSVVLHRQAPIRGRPRRSDRRRRPRRRFPDRVQAVSTRSDRRTRRCRPRHRRLREEVRRAGEGRADHRPRHSHGGRRRARIPHGAGVAGQHAARPPSDLVGRPAGLTGRPRMR